MAFVGAASEDPKGAGDGPGVQEARGNKSAGRRKHDLWDGEGRPWRGMEVRLMQAL